jgi:hypothetical protein
VWAFVIGSGICEAQFSPGLDPGTVVETQLEQGRFRNPLPFDVQFFIQAPIDDDIEEVQGKYARRRDAASCESLLADIPTQPPLSSFAPPPPAPPAARRVATEKPPQPPARGTIRGWLGYANLFENAMGTRVFELSVPPLSPRRDYCFQFVLRTKTDPATAREIVATALDQALQALPDETAIARDKAYDDFRNRVLDEIDRVLADKERATGLRLVLDVPSNSFFSRNAAENVRLSYRTQFAAVVQAQANRRNAIGDFSTNSAAAAEALRVFVTDARTQRLTVAVQANSFDPLIVPRVTALGLSLTLAGRDLTSIALGTDPEVAASLVDYSTTWDPAAIDARVGLLDARIRELTEFRQLARQLIDNETLRRAAGVQPAAAGAPDNPNALTTDDLNEIVRLATGAITSLTVARSNLARLQNLLRTRSAGIRAMAEQVGAELEKVVRFTGTTTTDWRTRATAYISADVGLAYSPEIDSFFFYFGTNIYLGPVNKKAPLSYRDDGWGTIRKRLALTFGIPLNPFEQNQTVTLTDPQGGQLDGVIGSRPLLVGIGWRLTDILRLTGGSVIFNVRDPNPLIDDKQLRRSGFIALSVDWDIKSTFSGLVGTTPPPTP